MLNRGPFDPLTHLAAVLAVVNPSDLIRIRGWMLVLGFCVLLTLKDRCKYSPAVGHSPVARVDTTPSVLQTQDVDFHHSQDKVAATESSTQQDMSQVDQSQVEISTVQAKVLPTTPDTMQQASSLMDTPMLDSYPHVRVLDGMPINLEENLVLPNIPVPTISQGHLSSANLGLKMTHSAESIPKQIGTGLSVAASRGGSHLQA
ncbi:hypothetical protein Btru_025760 [Bulinus truncatus]|nr:hypothetical protein Btru_025760 [Bulinus truncatus]